MRHPTRRQFLAGTAGLAAAALLPGRSAGQVIDRPASDKKVAAIVTTYHRYSHADNIVTRFMEGYSIVGKSFPPPCRVASLYIEQVGDMDIGRPLAKRWGVPVFNDKHLSYSWADAQWMYDQSRKLGFPMMAGSSVPVTWRRPDLRPKPGTPWAGALAVGYGHYEVYGFHTLEALQVMTEQRKGGETGVKAVQCLEGKEAWDAARAGRWDRTLLDAALARVPAGGRSKNPVEQDDADATVYLVEYRDGLHAAAYLSPRHVREFAFAGRVAQQADPLACWYELPRPQRDHFSFLVQHIAHMMVTGQPAYPVERTLLTTGMLAFLIDSKFAGHKRLETPELNIAYHPAAQ